MHDRDREIYIPKTTHTTEYASEEWSSKTQLDLIEKITDIVCRVVLAPRFAVREREVKGIILSIKLYTKECEECFVDELDLSILRPQNTTPQRMMINDNENFAIIDVIV